MQLDRRRVLGSVAAAVAMRAAGAARRLANERAREADGGKRGNLAVFPLDATPFTQRPTWATMPDMRLHR